VNNAMTIDELEAARDLYSKEIDRLERQGAEFGFTSEQVTHLVDKLKWVRDEYNTIISYHRDRSGKVGQ
jgi:hypothetical protein